MRQAPAVFDADCQNCDRPRREHAGGDMRCPDGSGSRYSRPGPDGAPTRKAPAQPSRHSTSFSRAELEAAAALLTRARTVPELRVIARSEALTAFERKVRSGLQAIESRVGDGAAQTSNGGDHG